MITKNKVDVIQKGKKGIFTIILSIIKIAEISNNEDKKGMIKLVGMIAKINLMIISLNNNAEVNDTNKISYIYADKDLFFGNILPFPFQS